MDCKNKLMIVVLLFVCGLTLSAYNPEENEEILHLGINAEIVEIDTERQIVYVVDYGEEVFGVKCGIARNLLQTKKLFMLITTQEKSRLFNLPIYK